jgi:hypothetical protein
VVVCVCYPDYGRKCKIGRSWSRLAWENKVRLYLQNNQSLIKKEGMELRGVAQAPT